LLLGIFFMTVRFCPQCGAKTAPQANFCAGCGEALPGAGGNPAKRTYPAAVSSWGTLMPGFVVLSLYLLIGTGLWVFVLQSQPFPSPATPAEEGQASKGGSTLFQEHPQVSLPEEAKKLLAELVEKANAAPQDVKTWKTLAEAQSRAARLDSSYRSAALSSYRHVLDLAPNDLDALRGVGNVYYDFEEYAKAVEYYQKYLTLNPEDSSVRTDLGTMYLYTNDADRAISEYRAVLAKKPDFFQAYFNLGIAYQEKGETDKARESLARAKALTTDKNIQTKIDEVLVQFGGAPSPTPTAAAPVNPARSPFQQAIEKIFRGHEIMGPRISRIEWPAPAEAHVFFQNFPMSAMPQEVRERFLGKLRTQVTEAKSATSISSMAKIELIDADTNQIMETITT
jgi:tetratricopeptide (TPR) repeat protein